MDKKLFSFLNYSFILVILFTALVAAFTFVYRSFTLVIYNRILLIVILLLVITAILAAWAALSIYVTLRKRKVSIFMLFPVKLGMKLLIPFATVVTGMLSGDKDTMRSLFVDLNNIFVESGVPVCRPDQLMVLLPHCLQYSECDRKVTGDINNCRKCGKCTIGEILMLARERGVKVAVVTGGTAARNLVVREKPKMLVSVACERDLSLGILDVGSIPVVGIVNKRPNGPCLNTTVDVELIKQKLDSLLAFTLKE